MSFIRKFLSFLHAVYSLIRHGDVTVKTYRLREAECLDCEHVISTSRNLYCGKCGCPKWWLSDLRAKWRMKSARCPLHRW